MITGLGIGGAETQVCSIADKLYNLGHNVTLIYLNGDKEVRPNNENIKVIGLNMKKTPLGLLQAYWKCRKILKKLNPDVLHSHMIHANIFSRLLHITVRIPMVISTAHSTNEGGKLRMLTYRFTNSLANLSTNVSAEALQSFITKKSMHPDKSIVVYNGVDTDKFVYNEDSREVVRKQLELDNDDFLFLAVGRLTESKDYPNLLNAFSNIVKSNPQAKLVIVGKGDLENEIKQLHYYLGLQNNTYFLGSRDDVHLLMSACDCFVLSSAYEGFGLVVAEAMSSQRVVIGTNCGGVKEVIGNEGFLVEPKDHIALANVMQKVINLESNQRKEIGLKARQRILNKYSLNATVTKWLELYQVPQHD